MEITRTTPYLGGAIAIAITSTMDGTGLGLFSALPLLLLTLVFWKTTGLSRSDMGLVRGKGSAYGSALVIPIVVVGALAAVAFLAGAVHAGDADWAKTFSNMALMSSTGILGTLLTEEGFFRGWLWGALGRSGRSARQTLVISSLIFMLWHVSAVTLAADFALELPMVPIYLINVFLLGMAWGGLRLLSGSVLVPAVCHALWNGLDYPLFGFGMTKGALDVGMPWLFGPETGLLGILANTLVILTLLGAWVGFRKKA